MIKIYWHSMLSVVALTYATLAFPDAGGASFDAVKGNEVQTSFATHHDVSAPLGTMNGRSSSTRKRILPLHRFQIGSVYDGDEDSVIQNDFLGAEPLKTILNFEGLGVGFKGPSGPFKFEGAPPDASGAVGPHHYFQQVNSSIAIFNKSGVAIFGPVTTKTVWKGFGGQCEISDDGDGSVYYDQLAHRWILSQFAMTSKPYLECVAVSVTDNPLGKYNRYAFQYKDFPDYPRLAVWPDAYYVAFNMFADDGSFNAAEVCAYDRNSMLKGLEATQQCLRLPAYDSLLPASLDGNTPPPPGTPSYLLSLGPDRLNFWKFHVDWKNSKKTRLSGPAKMPVAHYAAACGGNSCIPQKGTKQPLDSLGDRLMHRLVYRNFGDHESMVVTHSVKAGSSTGIRWYELRNPGSKLTMFQQGTYAPDSNFRWMSSIAMDKAGGIAVGYSISSPSMHPGIRFAGRLATDAPGVMGQGEGNIIDGGGSQKIGLERWGGVSSMSLDPTDGCTFYFNSEYLKEDGIFNWHTRVGSFKLPGCETYSDSF